MLNSVVSILSSALNGFAFTFHLVKYSCVSIQVERLFFFNFHAFLGESWLMCSVVRVSAGALKVHRFDYGQGHVSGL